MKKYLLEDFQKELSQIKEYVNHIKQVNDVASKVTSNGPVFQTFKTHFISFQTDKKVFEYKAIVISLYGLLEKYIQLWIQEYIKNISIFIPYNKLSQKIKKNHFEFSLKLLNERRIGKYANLKPENITKSLCSCLKSQESLNRKELLFLFRQIPISEFIRILLKRNDGKLYELNSQAFAIHTSNLKHIRVEEIFNNMLINISKEIIKNDELVTLTGFSRAQAQKKESKVLFGKINELVERRNIIAHGGLIDDLLGLSELEPYIEFLEKYCIAIFSVLKEKDIANSTIEKYQEVTCQGVFNNKTIIGISIKNYTIKIGDWVIIKTAEQNNEHFYKKEIKSLGKDNKNDYEELIIESTTNIAVGIENTESLPITQQCTFYIEKK